MADFAYQAPLSLSSTSTNLTGNYVAKTKFNPINLVTKPYGPFNSSPWTSSALTLYAGTSATTAPDGTNNAYKLVPTNVASDHLFYASVGTTFIGSVYTMSIFAKAAGYSYLYMSVWGPVGYQMFNLSTGEYGSGGVVNALAPGYTSAKIESVGNGWYRCQATFTAPLYQNPAYPYFYVSNSASATNITGDNTNGIYVWGAEMVAGATAISSDTYIQKTQLLSYPTDLSQANWVKVNSSITPNDPLVVAPDGTFTVDKIVASAGSFVHVKQTTPTLYNGQNYTSINHVKAGTKTFCTLGLHGLADAYFNLANLTYSFTGTGAVSASIIDIGGGWRRITATWIWGTGTTYVAYFAMANAFNDQANLSVGDTLYYWNAQLYNGTVSSTQWDTTAYTANIYSDQTFTNNTNWLSSLFTAGDFPNYVPYYLIYDRNSRPSSGYIYPRGIRIK